MSSRIGVSRPSRAVSAWPSGLPPTLRRPHTDRRHDVHRFVARPAPTSERPCPSRWFIGGLDEATGQVWAEAVPKDVDKLIAGDFIWRTTEPSSWIYSDEAKAYVAAKELGHRITR